MADLTVILDISNSLGPGLGLRLPAPVARRDLPNRLGILPARALRGHLTRVWLHNKGS